VQEREEEHEARNFVREISGLYYMGVLEEGYKEPYNQ